MRRVKLRAGKWYLEIAVQHLYPSDLSCDITASTQEHMMNAEAEAFRPRRNPSEIARVRINDLVNNERQGPFNE